MPVVAVGLLLRETTVLVEVLRPVSSESINVVFTQAQLYNITCQPLDEIFYNHVTMEIVVCIHIVEVHGCAYTKPVRRPQLYGLVKTESL